MSSMREKGKLALWFIAGGIVMNAGFAVSNAPSTQDLLSDALATAISKVNDREAMREEQELAKLPNILECQNMKWLENCSVINKQAKKNPTAPVRITNAKGLEFNFQPGTPSAMIRLQLEQTPEAAAAAVRYMDDTWGEYKESASLYQVAMWQTKMQHIKGLEAAQEEQEAVKDINVKGLSLSVFVESTCPVCDRYMGALEKLQKKYPQLSIRVFQLDQDKAAFMHKVAGRGLRGRVLSPSESAQLQQAGIRSWPISWIDHLPTKKRETLVGNRTLAQVENRLLAMTYQAKSIELAKVEK
jgi:thiol-disulfide isomerase/thioredoxin